MTDTTTKRVSIFDLYETNQDLETNGKWFEEFGPEVKIKIRRYTAPASRKVRDAILKPYLKQYKTAEKIPEEIMEDLTAQHLSRGVVTDWSGVFDRDGNEMPFSPDNVYALFRALPDLTKEVLLLSINMDNFKAEKKEEIKGN